MELTPLGIEGAWLAESKAWPDSRGHLREWFKYSDIVNQTGIDFKVEQANISVSKKGVIRGIHYSNAPEGQAKWVTCVKGAIRDVIVDVRPTSQTFGRHISVELRAQEGRSVLIGHGLGHGFIAMEDDSVVSYLISSEFDPKHELGIHPFDQSLKINWQIERLGGSAVIVSEKDIVASSFKDLIASKNTR
jgi:dTDP-4-dehydrorhamnose 3,5-epimerase